MNYVCSITREYTTEEWVRRLPLDSWGHQLSTVVHGSDPYTLRAVSCAALPVQVCMYTAQPPEAIIGVFTARIIGKGELGGNYYGTLVYIDLCREL